MAARGRALQQGPGAPARTGTPRHGNCKQFPARQISNLPCGEAESIVLAIEVRPDVLLLDEAEARRIAGLYDLPVTGVIGLLIQAKHEGLVSSLAEEMDRLREQGNFRIHDALYRCVLEEEKEG